MKVVPPSMDLRALNPEHLLNAWFILEPFRLKGEATFFVDYDIDRDQYRYILEFGRGSARFCLSIFGLGTSDMDVFEEGNTNVFNHMFRKVWRENYKVPDREPHIILGEN